MRERVAGASPSARVSRALLLVLAALAVVLAPGAHPTGAPAAAAGRPHAVQWTGVVHDVDGERPAPGRLELRHTAAGAVALERPAPDALPPAAAVAVPLLALGLRRRHDEGAHAAPARSGSARGPPASVV